MIKFLLWFHVISIWAGTGDDTTTKRPTDAAILHANQDALTHVIIYDGFTPPVAARIYAYTSLASYEAVRFSQAGSVSLAAQFNGFSAMPQPAPNKKYNFTLAASTAFFTVTHKVVFSIDSLLGYENSVNEMFKASLDSATYNRSVKFGEETGNAILQRAAKDNYFETRGKPKFIGSGEAGKWRPTAPDYQDAVEFYWGTMKTFILDSASQFMPSQPPTYSEDTSSAFFKGVKEVYDKSLRLTPEQKEIAHFWDDNPFVLEHAGHLMFARKKITPGGHWMGIAATAAKQTDADVVATARTYALTSATIMDAFIACWYAKYLMQVIRPITVINDKIDRYWTSYLQTPPFPEFSSGHSAVSASAATVLTALYGNDFSFQDTSELEYIGLQRHFDSFNAAAAEVSISRVLGGIHYTSGVTAGAIEGKAIADFILKKIK